MFEPQLPVHRLPRLGNPFHVCISVYVYHTLHNFSAMTRSGQCNSCGGSGVPFWESLYVLNKDYRVVFGGILYLLGVLAIRINCYSVVFGACGECFRRGIRFLKAPI